MHFELNRLLRVAIILGVLVFISSCGKSSETDVADNLVEQFEAADTTIKERVSVAEKALRNRDYESVLQSLNRVVTRRKPMSPEQRQAVLDSYHHVLQAVDQDPALDTPALYQSMAELNYRLHGEN